MDNSNLCTYRRAPKTVRTLSNHKKKRKEIETEIKFRLALTNLKEMTVLSEAIRYYGFQVDGD